MTNSMETVELINDYLVIYSNERSIGQEEESKKARPN